MDIRRLSFIRYSISVIQPHSPNLVNKVILQHDMLRRDRETLLFPDNFLRNFHLKPTGDVVLYLCRTLKVGDDWVRPKVTFLIAASYWKKALFMPDGIGGWKSSITNEAITEQALKREIGDHIEYGIYSDRTFRAACKSVVEDAAARQKDGKGPAPMSCIVWPSGAQIDLDDASLIEALTSIQEETKLISNTLSYTDVAELRMATTSATSIMTADATGNESC